MRTQRAAHQYCVGVVLNPQFIGLTAGLLVEDVQKGLAGGGKIQREDARPPAFE